jgi:hypothetical protein
LGSLSGGLLWCIAPNALICLEIGQVPRLLVSLIAAASWLGVLLGGIGGRNWSQSRRWLLAGETELLFTDRIGNLGGLAEEVEILSNRLLT